MSRAKPALPTSSSAAPAAIAAFLRGLAARVEDDAAFAAQVAAALWESGLLPGGVIMPARPSVGATGGDGSRHAGAARAATQPGEGELPDPFALLRIEGEDALRRVLDGLALPDLRRIVRAYRLDPARVSARWTVRERVIQLIVSQVRARLDHGKAFSRV